MVTDPAPACRKATFDMNFVSFCIVATTHFPRRVSPLSDTIAGKPTPEKARKASSKWRRGTEEKRYEKAAGTKAGSEDATKPHPAL
jgi:hypothetical protein